MTTAYFAPLELISGNRVVLPEEEARHAVQVLRHNVGDEIIVVDGEGGWYKVRLEAVGRKSAEGVILSRKKNVGEPEYELTIGMAILKNQKRFDVFVEKAVELGVTRIIPLITSRAEKKTIKEERIRKILIAAMKQSGRSRLVEFAEVSSFKDIVKLDKESLGLCCHEKADKDLTISGSLLEQRSRKNVTVFIGPEGGFTEEEISFAREHEIKIVSLGNRRLRAETAAIVASTCVSLIWH